MLQIRNASLADAERIAEIYADYVENTAISFEYIPPDADEMRRRMAKTMLRYPYLVIEENGRVEGYAYAGAFGERAAYAWSAEASIYLDRAAHKRGMGRMLYSALEQALAAMGISNLYACIAYPIQSDAHLNTNSADFHAHIGFRKVGEFHACGHKFGRWYNMIWMEKQIGQHKEIQPPVIPYPDLIHTQEE